MVADIATLGIAVDSTEVGTATKILQAFEAQAARAQKAANIVFNVDSSGVATASQAFGAAGVQLGRLQPFLDKTANSFNGLGERIIQTATNVSFLRGPLGGMAGNIAGLAATVQGLGLKATAVLGPLGLLAAAMVAGSKAAFEEAQQIRVLSAALEAAGGASGKTVEDINTLAIKLSQTSMVTEEAARSAAQGLLTFQSISGDTFDRILESAADLAALNYGGIEDLAFAIARAMEAPEEGFSRLRRVGLQFTDEQKHMVTQLAETGKKVEAQAKVLDLLADKTGGVAVKAADGLAGAMHRLSEATGNTFEALGEGIGILSDGGWLQRGLLQAAKGFERLNRMAGQEGPRGRVQQLREELGAMDKLTGVMKFLTDRTNERVRLVAQLEQAIKELREEEAKQAAEAAKSAEVQKKKAEEGTTTSLRELAEKIKKIKMTEAEIMVEEILTKNQVARSGDEEKRIRLQVDAYIALTRATNAQKEAEKAREAGKTDALGNLRVHVEEMKLLDAKLAKNKAIVREIETERKVQAALASIHESEGDLRTKTANDIRAIEAKNHALEDQAEILQRIENVIALQKGNAILRAEIAGRKDLVRQLRTEEAVRQALTEEVKAAGAAAVKAVETEIREREKLEAQQEDQQNRQQEIEQTLQVFTSGFEDAFTTMLEGTEIKWTQWTKTILNNLASLMLQLLILKPLVEALSQSLSGMTGGSGLVGMLGSVLGGGMGGGGAAAAGGMDGVSLGAPTSGWDASWISSGPVSYHKGTDFGFGQAHKSNVDQSIFMDAPRLHSGLAADEFPAVLQKGETVIPKGGSAVTNNFTVENHAPNTVTTREEKKNSTGGIDIRAVIRQVVTKEMGDPASDVHKTTKGTFGLSQAGVRR